jgi:ParB family transcriptional regulator, chromosome partitioning protein
VEQVPVRDIRPSPFQPKGRPSAGAVSAVRLAIAEAGSLDALASPEGGRFFARLDPEAARLAELAYDILQNGMKTPVEIRVAEDGRLECLSGHRRLAAAELAGIERVPALNNGLMTAAAAAATVLRGNIHRENFTSWQEALLVTEVQQRRQADGYKDNVRTLCQVMGWSHGKTNALLRIRKALPRELLARVSDGDGATVEESLSRVAYRDLERLSNEADEQRRLGALRQILGIHANGRTKRRAQVPYRHDPKRGGGFVIEVNAPVEALTRADAVAVKGALEAQLARVQARIQSLEHAV